MSRGQHTEEEKLKIRESRKATSLRRQTQVVHCYELKIVEKRLNKTQKEELDMIFLRRQALLQLHPLGEEEKRSSTQPHHSN